MDPDHTNTKNGGNQKQKCQKIVALLKKSKNNQKTQGDRMIKKKTD